MSLQAVISNVIIRAASSIIADDAKACEIKKIIRFVTLDVSASPYIL